MTRCGALIAGCLVAGCAALSPPLPAAPPGNPLIATATTPARHCASHDSQTLQALNRGDQRVVVVVKSFQPPTPPNARFTVSLVRPGAPKREVARFAVHPLRAISPQEPARQQRFLVSLASDAHLIDTGQPLCLEIGFDAGGAKLEGGMVEFDIELTRT